MSRILLLSPARTSRMINRMAFEIIERNQGADNLVVVGIRKRGSAIAEAISAQIETEEGVKLAENTLDVMPFRDDRDPAAEVKDESVIASALDDRDVILVDDVLFTGRTARAALDAIVQHGRPRSIQLAILIDRGHREYPIQPDYVGRRIPTKARERIRVDVGEGFAVYSET